MASYLQSHSTYAAEPVERLVTSVPQAGSYIVPVEPAAPDSVRMHGIAQPQVSGGSVVGATAGCLASSRVISGGVASVGVASTGITSTAITSSVGVPANKRMFDHRVMSERHITREELESSGNLLEGPSLPPIGDSVEAVHQVRSRIPAPAAITAPAATTVAYEPLNTVYGEPPRAAMARVAAPSVTHVSSAVQNSPRVHRVQVAPAVSTVPAATTSAVFDSIDRNHDGVISRAEFNQAMANVASTSVRSGRMPVAII